MTHENLEGVRGEEGGRIGEDHDPVAGAGHGLVERVGLSPALGEEDRLDTGVRGGAQDVVGPVGGAVGDEDHLQPVARVVEPADIGELGRQVLLLVVGGDDERHRRQLGEGGRRWSAVAARSEVAPVPPDLHQGGGEEQEDGVEDVGVRHQEETDPEEALGRGHGPCA